MAEVSESRVVQNTFTTRQIAEWMQTEFLRTGILPQYRAAYVIQTQFGERFVYRNRNGNLAIARDVLAKFRQMNKAEAVWSRGSHFWRRRLPTDPPDARMVN